MKGRCAVDRGTAQARGLLPPMPPPPATARHLAAACACVWSVVRGRPAGSGASGLLPHLRDRPGPPQPVKSMQRRSARHRRGGCAFQAGALSQTLEPISPSSVRACWGLDCCAPHCCTGILVVWGRIPRPRTQAGAGGTPIIWWFAHRLEPIALSPRRCHRLPAPWVGWSGPQSRSWQWAKRSPSPCCSAAGALPPWPRARAGPATRWSALVAACR